MSTAGRERATAWAVHLYTALGAPIAVAALVAAANGRYRAAFAYMAAAMAIDCTDGFLARRFRVGEVLPHFDGARLDDIVDYLNYVVVPLFVAQRAELLPAGGWGFATAALPLLASGYGFSQVHAKTPDHFFTGFPSYWNVVVFYLYVFEWPRWLNAAILVAFAVLVFVPIGYLYPSRNPEFRKTTMALAVLWAAAILALVAQLPDPSRRLAAASLFFPTYYVGLSLWLHWHRAPTAIEPRPRNR